jgi:hypothetical protein
MAYLYSELRALSKGDLIRQYDQLAPRAEPGLAFVREELARREFEEQNQRMITMTDQISRMTRLITWLTVANTIFVALTLWRTL